MNDLDKMIAEMEVAKRGERPMNEGIVFDFQRQNTLMPEGIHTFEITEVKEKSGEETPSGFPYINLTLECLTKEFEGQHTFHGFSLAPTSRWILDKLLDAVGAPTDGKTTTQFFVGKRLKARIVHSSYENKEGMEVKKAEVKEVYPVNYQPKEKASNPAEELKKLAKQTKPKTQLPSDVSS